MSELINQINCTTTLRKIMLETQERIADLLSSFIYQKKLNSINLIDKNLFSAVEYSCLNGGKRLRPLLTYATGKLLDIPKKILDPIATSIELIHCYSLVHDDLPAMDDDNLRRGQPTCHIKFNEPTAILVGDALQTMAFEIISNDSYDCIDDKTKIKIINLLTRTSGINGMIGGQADDMASEGKSLTIEELKNMHLAKTGAIIQASIEMPAIISDSKLRSNLVTFAKHIGLGFQVCDDILDVTSNDAILGKPCKSDLQQGKATFVNLLGIQQAKEYAQECYLNAIKSLKPFGEKSNLLKEIANFFINREY